MNRNAIRIQSASLQHSSCVLALYQALPSAFRSSSMTKSLLQLVYPLFDVPYDEIKIDRRLHRLRVSPSRFFPPAESTWLRLIERSGSCFAISSSDVS